MESAFAQNPLSKSCARPRCSRRCRCCSYWIWSWICGLPASVKLLAWDDRDDAFWSQRHQGQKVQKRLVHSPFKVNAIHLDACARCISRFLLDPNDIDLRFSAIVFCWAFAFYAQSWSETDVLSNLAEMVAQVAVQRRFVNPTERAGERSTVAQSVATFWMQAPASSSVAQSQRCFQNLQCLMHFCDSISIFFAKCFVEAFARVWELPTRRRGDGWLTDWPKDSTMNSHASSRWSAVTWWSSYASSSEFPSSGKWRWGTIRQRYACKQRGSLLEGVWQVIDSYQRACHVRGLGTSAQEHGIALEDAAISQILSVCNSEAIAFLAQALHPLVTGCFDSQAIADLAYIHNLCQSCIIVQRDLHKLLMQSLVFIINVCQI